MLGVDLRLMHFIRRFTPSFSSGTDAMAHHLLISNLRDLQLSLPRPKWNVPSTLLTSTRSIQTILGMSDLHFDQRLSSSSEPFPDIILANG